MPRLRKTPIRPAHGQSRRRTLQGLGAALTLSLSAGYPSLARAAPDLPNKFMRKVVRELMAAQRSGSPVRLLDTIRRHADVAAIGLFSLGSYSSQVSQERRGPYFSGMTRFMAHYIFEQAKNYPIKRMRVTGDSESFKSGYRVATDVTLTNGNTYDVRWHIVERDGELKVRDAQALGYWATPFQQKLFMSYIKKHNGNVDALLIAMGA